MKLLFRTLLTFIVVIAVFMAGVFAGSNGVFGWLTGNIPVSTNVVTILDRVQALSQLTTTRYSYTNMLSSERELPPVLRALYGDRLIMVAVGHVNAGIDLSLLTTDDITTVENELVIRLPPAVLQDCFFNEQASYVVSRDTGVFSRPVADLDENARLYALGKFRDNAFEQGILADAQTQAETAVRELVGGVTGSQYRAIRITSDPQPAAPVLPPTCQ
ncbi:MAG: DUF4230 domain-containing protein [Armatimonadetes bacterium]|nr:DUF4230 domain-containing protein [Anaerolineae bacterium]